MGWMCSHITKTVVRQSCLVKHEDGKKDRRKNRMTVRRKRRRKQLPDELKETGGSRKLNWKL